MKCLCVALLVCGVLFESVVCPPVTKKPGIPNDVEEGRSEEDANFGLEYERYLKEVVSVLESDDAFRKKLEESNISDIKSGEIARHLEFVNHGIRTKLDEIKRKEVDRLRQMLKIQTQIQRGMHLSQGLPINPAALIQGLKKMGHDVNMPQVDHKKVLGHVDHSNPNTFEVEDLAKLIQRATQDLEDIDKKRRDEFKQYELEKAMEKQHDLEKLEGDQRKEQEAKFDEMKKKHADHPKLHHPGGKDQLEEVWEETDGMDKNDFDPKTFFQMHDTNGDGTLDEMEVEALFQKELDKVYDPTKEEDDPIERYEEMNRMREHVFNEVDKDKNKVISLAEFLDSTKGEEFEKDEGWDTLDEQEVYSDDELEQFVKDYEERQRQGYEDQGHQVPVDPSMPPQGGADHLQGQGAPIGGAQHMQQQQMGGNHPAPGQGQPMRQVPHGQGQLPVPAQGQGQLPQHPRVPTNQ